jgi:hypothetical protein
MWLTSSRAGPCLVVDAERRTLTLEDALDGGADRLVRDDVQGQQSLDLLPEPEQMRRPEHDGRDDHHAHSAASMISRTRKVLGPKSPGSILSETRVQPDKFVDGPAQRGGVDGSLSLGIDVADKSSGGRSGFLWGLPALHVLARRFR